MRPLRLVVGVLAAVALLRACGVAPYRIPSGSMAGTLLPGDHVIVEKVSLGARLPLGMRLPGLRGLLRGDVVVFDAPFPHRLRLLKRIVALPGDTVAMQAGTVFINGRPLAPPPQALLDWRDCTDRRVEMPQRMALARSRSACPVLPYRAPRGTIALLTFPEGAGNTDTDVAPMRVPRRGDTLHLGIASWARVRDVLRLEGHAARLLPGGAVRLDGKETRRYVVRDDYYYVLGDHRSASTDSRAWGFVPQRLVIGRAVVVHYAADTLTGRPRWTRIGQGVR